MHKILREDGDVLGHFRIFGSCTLEIYNGTSHFTSGFTTREKLRKFTASSDFGNKSPTNREIMPIYVCICKLVLEPYGVCYSSSRTTYLSSNKYFGLYQGSSGNINHRMVPAEPYESSNYFIVSLGPSRTL